MSLVPAESREPAWFTVATKPRHELEAERNLLQQGYSVLLPRISIRKRQKSKWCDVIEPLFPGYLFVQLQFGSDDPAPIRSTVGCIGLVRFGQAYVPVPQSIIAPLLGVDETPLSENREFKLGEQVRFESGPFAGLSGVFQMRRGEDRARVLIELLGKPREVSVVIDDLTRD